VKILLRFGKSLLDKEHGMSKKKQIVDLGLAEEQALRESEERFRTFVMASWEVVYRMSPDWKEMRYLKGKDFLVG
jgi:hypothetical protein